MSGLLSEDVLSHIGKQSEPRREIVRLRTQGVVGV